MASQQVPDDHVQALYRGELSLKGDVRHTDGILPMVSLARDKGVTTVFVPAADALEASLVEGIAVLPVKNFAAVINHLRGDQLIEPFVPDHSILAFEPEFSLDFSNVKGQMYTPKLQVVDVPFVLGGFSTWQAAAVSGHGDVSAVR